MLRITYVLPPRGIIWRTGNKYKETFGYLQFLGTTKAMTYITRIVL
jgi:hypothetical protein